MLVPVALTWPATSGIQASAFDLDEIKRILTGEIEEILATGTPSVSIALVRDGDIVWTAAFGQANV